jgi:acetyltransferase-like isoleucine patch superfamily enzyme
MKLIQKLILRIILRIRIIRSHSYLARGSDISIDKSVRFGRWCFLTSKGGEIVIGENTFLNTQVILNADIGGKIHISNDCMIGPRTIFRTANHKFDNITSIKRGQGHTFANIFVERNVWIGANVTVLSGVTIGENSVIAAGAVVTEDVPKNCLAAGVPAIVKKCYD